MGYYKNNLEDGPCPCRICNCKCSCPDCAGGPGRLTPAEVTFLNHHPRKTIEKNSRCLGTPFGCPQPDTRRASSVMGGIGGGTTYPKAMSFDNATSDFTQSGCQKIPLVGGGSLSIVWTRWSGMQSGQNAFQDGWTPGGEGGIHSFLPIVNNFLGATSRYRSSDKGSVQWTPYSGTSDIPNVDVPYVAVRGTTYWTEYSHLDHTYYEYFAGSGLALTDPMFGRLNRLFDTNGNQLQYYYSPNAGGQQLLRKITGFAQNLIPYFGYADETVSGGKVAPITTVYLADLANASNSKAVYFEYTTITPPGYPYLTKIVSPSGCTTQYYPQVPFDFNSTYRIQHETDAEGYTTYFFYVYNIPSLAFTIEPGNRIVYYEYDQANQVVNRIENGRPKGFIKWQTGGLAMTTLITQKTDPMGQTTYFVTDPSIARVGKEVLANGHVTYYTWVGVTAGTFSDNRYALRSVTTALNGAQTYFDYLPNSYSKTMQIDPRHVPGVFSVVTYYNYDTNRNLLSNVDALGAATYFAYDSLGLVIFEQDARGYTTYFNYGVTAFVDNFGIVPLGLVTEIVDPLVNTTYYGWNIYGDKLWAVSPRCTEPGGLPAFTSYFTYDTRGLPAKVLDPLGNVTYYTFTSRGDLMSQVDARGVESDYTYDGLRNRTSIAVKDQSGVQLTQYQSGFNNYQKQDRTQDALGNVTYYVFDVIDRLTALQDAAGGVSYFFYDNVNNLTCRIDQRQDATYFFYDLLSRLTSTQDALGNAAYYFYDLADNPSASINPLGAGTYYFYDALNRTQAMQDALASPSYFFYDQVGNISSVRDALGFSAYFFYDALNRRSASRNPLTGATYFGYDAMGNLRRLLNPRASVSYFTYDAVDRLQTGIDALGNSTYYFYDAVGNISAILDGRGTPAYYFYDGLSRQTVFCDAQAQATYFFYDAASNRTQQRDPIGNTTYYFYDSLNRLSAIRDALANWTYFFYDAASNRTHLRDARGNATYFFYDNLNRLSVLRDAVGNASYFFYDAASQRSYVLDARGYVTYFIYDLLGRMTQSEAPEQAQMFYTYDAVGNVTLVRREDTFAWNDYGVQEYGTSFYGGWLPADEQAFYDGLSRVTVRLDALGNSTYYAYDANANRTTLLNPLFHSTYFGYDALDRLCRLLDPLGGTTYFEFDASGNLTKVLDADAHAVLNRLDTLNRPDAVRMPDTGSSYFFYDKASNRIRTIDGRGNTTYYKFDALNRATATTDALWRTLYFEYDSVSNLTKSMNVEGSTSVHTYDALNRRTQTVYTAVGADVAASLGSSPYYVYDQVGNTVQMGDFWGLHLVGYDGLRRPLRHQFPRGQVVYYEYSPRSQTLAIVYPGSSGRSARAFDVLLHPTRVQAPSGASAYFSYDAGSNLTQRFLGNNARTDITYDTCERISQWRNSDKNGNSLTYFDYSRDAKGLVTKAVREANYTVYFSYDASDRILSELWAKTGATPSEVYGYRYAYDVAGNRIKAKVNGSDTYYFYDTSNQLKVTGSTSAYASPTYYIYDKNGSLTNLVEPSGATYFAYNPAGLIARIRWRDATPTYFYYDGLLQRYGMVAAGTTAATYFLWDGPNLLQELNADGTVKEEHTNVQTPIAGIGQLVETNRPGQSPQKIYPVMDPRGSITKQIQSDGSTVQAAREYDSFGNLIPNSASGTWLGRFGYQGQSWLEILSGDGTQRLFLSPTRIYDPVTARFIQNEPLLRRRPMEHFLYGSNNPARYVDPSGLDLVDWLVSKRKAFDQWVNNPGDSDPLVEGLRGGLRGLRDFGDRIGSSLYPVLDHPGELYNQAVENFGQTVTEIRDNGFIDVVTDAAKGLWNSQVAQFQENPEKYISESAADIFMLTAPTPDALVLGLLADAVPILEKTILLPEQLRFLDRPLFKPCDIRPPHAREGPYGNPPQLEYLNKLHPHIDDIEAPTPFKILDGRVYDKYLPSSPGSAFHGPVDFIIDADGTLKLGAPHSALSQGEDVLAAGRLIFDDGKLIGIRPSTGHYQVPNTSWYLEDVLARLRAMGIDTSSASLLFVTPMPPIFHIPMRFR